MLLFAQLVLNSNASASEQLRIGGSGTDLATMKLLTTAFAKQHKGLQITIPSSLGSSGGIKGLIAGKLDLAITSRKLKEHEKQPGLKVYQYASTPLVFATSNTLPVNSVTTDELNNIYSGQNPYWQGGQIARPILRPHGDSDTIILKKYFPELTDSLNKAYKRRGVPIARTDQDSVQRIENIPGGIGTSTLCVLLSENRKIKALTLNGVAPSVKTITNGKYSLVKDLYIVIPDKTTSVVRSFILFMNSIEARKIFEKTGHQVKSFDFQG